MVIKLRLRRVNRQLMRRHRSLLAYFVIPSVGRVFQNRVIIIRIGAYLRKAAICCKLQRVMRSSAYYRKRRGNFRSQQKKLRLLFHRE